MTAPVTVRIRLKHMGKAHTATYRVVVVDPHKKRSDRITEELGIYDPQPNPLKIRIGSDRAQYWLDVGAQPPDQVRNPLVFTGDIAKLNGRIDTISRVEVSEVDKAATAAETVEAAEAEAGKSRVGKATTKTEEEIKAAAEASAEGATEAGKET